jgi:hypothetical protein
MNISRKSIKPFRAKVTLGLFRGYTTEIIDKKIVIEYIQLYQNQLIKSKNIYLSVSLSESTIILNYQKEPHLILNLINYPKFELEIPLLKKEIEKLIKHLMDNVEQNRVIIEYLDETVMLESSPNVDPNVLKN